MSELIAPYGGALIDLVVSLEEREESGRRATTLPSITLSERSRCDLELLATGAFSPLDRFLGAADFASVLETMRLTSGELFPVPVTLPVSSPPSIGSEIALRIATNEIVATMHVEEIYPWDLEATAAALTGTTDRKHPLVAEMERWGRFQISGPLRVIRTPTPRDFPELRQTPAEVRTRLAALGRTNVVAFQTRNPLHRAHEELTRRAIDRVDGALLLHPVVGLTKPGDIDHVTRVRTYKVIASSFPADRIHLALLPLAMRMAGPREALWHAIIRRNFGANHFIVGRDHASPGSDSQGRPFYGPYDAQQLVERHQEEIGVRMLPFAEMVYLSSTGKYVESTEVPAGAETLSISGTQVRDDYLRAGRRLPEWFTRPEVAQILEESCPPRHREGFCIWFTGLSGAGKSTTAERLVDLLMDRGRQVTLLDGDVVRTHLSKGLGFSREDRDTNIMRIGFVAAEVARHGGAVVCAAVSPYRGTRESVRSMVGAERFIEVFVDTPLEVCEQRDVKGIYRQAREGLVRNVTGIDDPYEEPLAPELRIDAASTSADENARRILEVIIGRGYVR